MQIGFLDNISFLFEEIIIIGIIGIMGWLINHFRNKGKDIVKLRKEVYNLRGRQLQLQQALIILVTLTDEQVKKIHPKEFMEFEGIIKEVLNDVNFTLNNNK